MANQKKRIALTVPDDMDAVLERLSVLTNAPKTKLIMEMLEEYIPVLERTVDALEQIATDKENAVDIAKKFASELLLEGNEKLGFLASEVRTLDNPK
jgi:predicted DNA-binding protein